MNGFNYKDVPAAYTHCIVSDCPLMSTCLRSLAWQALPESVSRLMIINPAKAAQREGCPDYRNSTPVTFAYGFKRMKNHMFPGQYSTFKSKLMGRWGRSAFYKRHQGKCALSPQEQEFIRAALKKAGAAEDLDFDRYEEGILW